MKNVKKYRKKRGYSQQLLAEKCDVSVGYISEIEIGRKFPSHTLFDKLTTALEINPYQLLIDDDTNRIDYDRTVLVELFGDRLRSRLHEAVEETVKEFSVVHH